MGGLVVDAGKPQIVGTVVKEEDGAKKEEEKMYQQS
ncbi:hypothetical protein TIFTF001_028578 [Ficus carica]|uniref:Uncharacterized protein n=1 Tax=Ficus carica TaxID=3494 RepID=A0AA88DQ75_FICCA|nr:hypothetical protein TIFTF001_028578 [Ficus carica]